MLNKEILHELLQDYTSSIDSYLQGQGNRWSLDYDIFKLEAIKCFQDNWNIEADNFCEMLTSSFAKTGNLLIAARFIPESQIEGWAKADSDAVRSMFVSLYDEKTDLGARINNFSTRASSLFETHKVGDKSYQDEHDISVYLWLRYPDKYYIYEFNRIKVISDKIESGYPFTDGDTAYNFHSFISLLNEIRHWVKHDKALVTMYKALMPDNCYPDPELCTLTDGFAKFIYYNICREKSSDIAQWGPPNYDPGITVNEWITLLSDSTIFTPKSLEVIKRMKDNGGQASCKELSKKYGNIPNSYNRTILSLGANISKKGGYSMYRDWWQWTPPFLARSAKKDEAGSTVYRLRDELSRALDYVDLSDVPLYADGAAPKNEMEETVMENPAKAAFLSEVFLSPAEYDLLTALIRRKKNVILQGAPGVGKTFAAKRLAWAMMGEKDESRVGFVQFHQSYSYEDFIMGYKPTAEGGFELRRGLFHNFCQKAAADDGRDYFLIIDEINRGNLSKIFGEALMLIEADKRGEAITLASGNDGEKFSVPPNLFIIGLMNTADRSLAIIDYALRRRFSFFDMKPAFDSEGFKNRQKAFGSPKLDNLIELVKSLNTEIAGDESLGQGFCLGHSYFCENPGTIGDVDGWLHQVVDYDLIPTLGEYWFDKPENVERWAAALHGALE